MERLDDVLVHLVLCVGLIQCGILQECLFVQLTSVVDLPTCTLASATTRSMRKLHVDPCQHHSPMKDGCVTASGVTVAPFVGHVA